MRNNERDGDRGDDVQSAARRLRLRRALSRRWLLVTAVLLGVAVTGGWLTATAFVWPDTSSETRVTDTWQRSGAFTHSATVTEQNPAFDTGTRLHNRSTYLQTIAPQANVTYRLGYQASERGRLNATVRLRLVREATDGNGGVLWRVSDPLTRANQTLEPGERLRTSVILDAPAVANRSRNLTSRLGSVGRTETVIVAETRLRGRVNGERVDQQFRQRLVVTVGGDKYSFSTLEPATRSFQSKETTTQQREYGPAFRVGGPLLLLVGAGGAIGLVGARRRGRLSITATQREWLAYRDEYETYEAWIHRAALPPETATLPAAEAATLGDLVDIAIDTDESVIEVPADGTFHVVRDGYRYVYHPPRVAPRLNGNLSDASGKVAADTEQAPKSAPGDGTDHDDA